MRIECRQVCSCRGAFVWVVNYNHKNWTGDSLECYHVSKMQSAYQKWLALFITLVPNGLFVSHQQCHLCASFGAFPSAPLAASNRATLICVSTTTLGAKLCQAALCTGANACPSRLPSGLQVTSTWLPPSLPQNRCVLRDSTHREVHLLKCLCVQLSVLLAPLWFKVKSLSWAPVCTSRHLLYFTVSSCLWSTVWGAVWSYWTCMEKPHVHAHLRIKMFGFHCVFLHFIFKAPPSSAVIIKWPQSAVNILAFACSVAI